MPPPLPNEASLRLAPRVWVTRAEPGATRTAERLSARGFAPVVQPVLVIRPLEDAAASSTAQAGFERGVAERLAGVSALVFTSPNGVAIFAAMEPAGRDLSVFAVGDATADAARQAGFRSIVSAAGDASRLAEVIAQSGLAAGAVLLHPGARTPARDIRSQLAGITVRHWPIYDAFQTHVNLPADCLAVLVHSPRAGHELARRRAEGQPLPMVICAISRAAAAPLETDPVCPVHVAQKPDDASVLDCLHAALGKRAAPV